MVQTQHQQAGRRRQNCPAEGASHKAGIHPNPFPGASPAATKEEQVLDSGNSGVCILTSDQVAVQHHMHGVGLTGYGRGHKP